MNWILPLFLPLGLMLVSGDLPRREEAGVGPAPAPFPVSWEFELRFEDPRRIEVSVPGRGQPEVYWYLLYTVVNRSDTTQYFFPTFQIVLEDLQVVDTDMGIHASVFEAIRQRHRLTHKYLTHPTAAIGDLKSGEDNARESVAIWRDVELGGNRFSIFAAGLSGETRVLKNPSHDPAKPETMEMDAGGRQKTVSINPRYFTLRKTLEIRYDLPGSEAGRRMTNPTRSLTRWVMR